MKKGKLKQILSFVLSLVLVISMVFVTVPGEVKAAEGVNVSINANKTEVHRGDNEIDILDILACLDHTSEKEVLTGTAHQAADVVEDGIVDIFDLMKLLDYVNERIDSL